MPETEGVVPGSVAMITVDELRVRDEPGLSADVVARLSQGDEVFVTDQPRVEADGVSWVLVQGEWIGDGDGSGTLGYVAAGDDSSSFLETTEVACPSAAITDVGALAALTPWARLSCFGGQTLTLTGYDNPENYGFGGLCNCVAEPDWLIHPFAFRVLSPSSQERLPWLFVRLAPGVEAQWPADPGSTLRVTGHFDDPNSASCEFSTPDPTLVPNVEPTFEDKNSVVLRCREQFVLTEIVVANGQ